MTQRIHDLRTMARGHHYEPVSGTMDVNDVSKVAGHLTPRPQENDLMLVNMGSGEPGLYRFFDIEYCNDPKDMFFAKVDWHGYEKEMNK